MCVSVCVCPCLCVCVPQGRHILLLIQQVYTIYYCHRATSADDLQCSSIHLAFILSHLQSPDSHIQIIGYSDYQTYKRQQPYKEILCPVLVFFTGEMFFRAVPQKSEDTELSGHELVIKNKSNIISYNIL